MLGFVWTIYIILRTLFVGDLAPGWPAMISILLIGFGITNLSLGIIAEYLWRTFDASRDRKIYIIDKVTSL
jgi:dolichol-phosphate mannosyltransferase